MALRLVKELVKGKESIKEFGSLVVWNFGLFEDSGALGSGMQWVDGWG